MQKTVLITKMMILSAIALVGIPAQSGSDKEGDKLNKSGSFDPDPDVEKGLAALEMGELSGASGALINLDEDKEDLTYLLVNHMMKNQLQLSTQTRVVFAKKIQRWVGGREDEEKKALGQLFTEKRSGTRSKKKGKTSEQLKMFKVQQQLLQYLIESSEEATELQIEATKREIRQARRGTQLAITGLALTTTLSLASLITTIVIAATGS